MKTRLIDSNLILHLVDEQLELATHAYYRARGEASADKALAAVEVKLAFAEFKLKLIDRIMEVQTIGPNL